MKNRLMPCLALAFGLTASACGSNPKDQQFSQDKFGSYYKDQASGVIIRLRTY